MNDERPIEKLLRRAAQKRHDEAGAPPELHPANRRLLQAEVARQHPRTNATQASAWAEFWNNLTRRWVFALGIFIVLGIVAAGVFWPGDQAGDSMNLAQNIALEKSRNPLAMSVAPAASTPAAIPAEAEMNTLAQLDSSGGGNFRPASEAVTNGSTATFSRTAGEISDRANAPESVPAAPELAAHRTLPPDSKGESKAKLTADEAVSQPLNQRSLGLAATRAQPARPPESTQGRASSTTAEATTLNPQPGGSSFANATRSEALGARTLTPTTVANESQDAQSYLPRGGGLEETLTVLNSQAFSNVSPEQLARKKAAQAYRAAPLPVLNNFQIQQQGRDLRVVDGDGSIYKGVVDEENTFYKQVLTQKERQLSQSFDNRARFQAPKLADATATATKPSAENFYFYRVEGTNRSLNQHVVFSWNFVPTNDALAAAQLDYKNSLLKIDATKAPPQFPLLLQNSFIEGRARFGESQAVEVNAVPVKP